MDSDTADWDALIVINTSPFYNETIQNRYLKLVSLATTNLNVNEKKWLKEHNNPIKFGYLEGFPTLCYTDVRSTWNWNYIIYR